MSVKDVTAVRITYNYNRFIRAEGREPTEDEIYQIARWAWWHPQQCGSVFACVTDGGNHKVVGVYEVDRWYSPGDARNRPGLRPDFPNAHRFKSVRDVDIQQDILENRRLAFVGHCAACANQFLGRYIEDFDIHFNPRNPVTSGRVNEYR